MTAVAIGPTATALAQNCLARGADEALVIQTRAASLPSAEELVFGLRETVRAADPDTILISATRLGADVVARLTHRRGSERLHSIFVYDYAWDPNAPARGDVRWHGIYSFRDQVRSPEDYGYRCSIGGPLLFGAVKIWGEIIEHEAGYRSEFAKIVSLDNGDPQLLERFREAPRSARFRKGAVVSVRSNRGRA